MPGGHEWESGFRDRTVQRGGGSGELRQGNLTQILRYLRDHGSSSRHDVARGCGLGVSTMTDLVGDLRARGLVVELDPIRRPGAGRPTRPIALDGSPWYVLGAQVEADHLTLIGATVGGEQLWHEQIVLDLCHEADGAAAVAGLLQGQLERFPEPSRLVAVEVGVPGPVTPDGVLTASRSLGWADAPVGPAIRTMLARTGLAGVRVGVSTDAHLAGLQLARTALADSSSAVAVYLGGVRDLDSAVVLDGEIFRGAAGGAGDLGHLHVAEDGPGCWCGRPGCVNAFARLEHLLVRGDLTSVGEATRMVAEQPCKALSLVAEAAASGEPEVLRALEEAGDALGRAIDDVIGTLNPDAVLLGGSLGRLAPYLMAALERRLEVRREVAPYGGTQLLALDHGLPQVADGAVLAARDACLYDPLGLTRPLV
jgi:predicted NBD/HSP70 family sugar kinase